MWELNGLFETGQGGMCGFAEIDDFPVFSFPEWGICLK